LITTDHPIPEHRTAVIILAAGSSSRLGKPKQLLNYQGETLIKHTVKTVLQTSCIPLIVVSGFLHEELVAETKNFPVQLIHNPDWEKGMGSSIQTGITALNLLKSSNQIDAVLILLCDQPLITAEHLNKLITQFYRHKRSIVATGYAETQGVPAIFGKSLFPILQTLPGNRGAQWLFKEYQDQLTVVPFEGAAIDVDTKDDYLRLLKLSEGQ